MDRFRATVTLDMECETLTNAATITQTAMQYGCQYSGNYNVKGTVLKVERIVPADESSQK